MVRTLEREHFYFALNDRERDLWLTGFAKIISYNTSTQGTFNLKITPDISKIQEEKIQAAGGGRKEVKVTSEGLEAYLSQALTVTRYLI